ncbi:hypothetical protein AB0F46_01610 [Streptomyces sp. NPDC026665]|uniref:hypothetical protein n=1 Tax=Streptomyces sp. NPDC026665 TaxID=3154798 RepID=UPI0033D524D5
MSDQIRGALSPVEVGEGTFVHPGRDRRLAAAHWLLSAAADRKRARTYWRDGDVAMLNLGTLFSAVRIPAAPLLALVMDRAAPSAHVDEVLAEVLAGPAICDPRHQRYYALVPASMPITWADAAADWKELGVEMLGRESVLGVPDLTRTEPGAHALASYWSVPMGSAGELCSPLSVARLIAAAARVAPEEVTL